MEREQSLARKIYLTDSNHTLRCVWSEKPLDSRTLDVDHVLPYSLLHNNDLWNLLPAHKAVNNNKRAGVPSNTQLSKSKDLIVSNWQVLRAAEPNIFDFELQRALGELDKHNWERDLFNHLKNKSNHMIFARGATAWNYSAN